jgi:hypothetical protein
MVLQMTNSVALCRNFVRIFLIYTTRAEWLCEREDLCLILSAQIPRCPLYKTNKGKIKLSVFGNDDCLLQSLKEIFPWLVINTYIIFMSVIKYYFWLVSSYFVTLTVAVRNISHLRYMDILLTL